MKLTTISPLVGKMEENGETRYSLSCNSDLTLDLVPHVRDSKREGAKIELLAQVNPNLPFMYGYASVPSSYFDAIVDNPKYTFPLFGPPNRNVDIVEYFIALHVTALIKDGGTLQIGIGALEDAVTYFLKLRHQQNDLYRAILNEAGVLNRFGDVVERLGGSGPFKQGLYASSEMLVDGFLELYRTGILKRRVYDHLGLQRLSNEGRIAADVTPAIIDVLVYAEVISSCLTRQDFVFLQDFGILRPELNYEDGSIQFENGKHLPANLADKSTRDEIARQCLGTHLKGGHFAHACFFLGPRKFYENLRQMDPSEREQICMTGIGYVNHLYGEEELKRLQRKAARFVNTGLIVTLTGAVASDGFEDGRVLSGVGGQYNFVSMALSDLERLLRWTTTASEAPRLAKYAAMDTAPNRVRTRKPARGTVPLAAAARQLTKRGSWQEQNEFLSYPNSSPRPIHSGCPDKCESAFVLADDTSFNARLIQHSFVFTS